ncbi:MAG: hypothetical protein QM736_00710 [Vicinamibacterales bacterium]
MLKALIVDDEELAREGIRMMLGRESDVEVVGEAADGPSATEAILAAGARHRLSRRQDAGVRRFLRARQTRTGTPPAR